MKLTIDKKAAIFKSLVSGTLYDVGIEYGFDKHYKDATAIRNKVYAIYREVANSPEDFALAPETVALVVDTVSNRKVATREPKLAEKIEKINQDDIKGLTMGSRDVAGKLIKSKLEYLEKHPKALQAESLVNLGKIFGIMFDKSQIIQGQATEHVAVMGRIDSNLSPEEALAAVLRSREITQAEKHG